MGSEGLDGVDVMMWVELVVFGGCDERWGAEPVRFGEVAQCFDVWVVVLLVYDKQVLFVCQSACCFVVCRHWFLDEDGVFQVESFCYYVGVV